MHQTAEVTTPLVDLLFDEPDVGRCLAREDGRVIRVNRAWLHATNRAEVQVLEAHLSELLPRGVGPAEPLIQRALAGERVELRPAQLATKPHDRRWYATLQTVSLEGERYLLLTARTAAPLTAESAGQTIEALLACVPEGITISSSTDAVNTATSRWGDELLMEGWKSGAGVSMAEWIERVEIYHADGVTRARLEELPLWRASQLGETVSNEEFILKRPDGRLITTLASAGPIRDVTNAVTGGIIVWRDVTVYKQALQIERAFLDAIEQLQDGFYALDRDWRLTFLNRAAAEKFGLPAPSLVGKVLWEARPSVLGSPHEALFRRVMNLRVPDSIELPGTLDDRWYRISCSPSEGGITVLYSDVTERKRSELALKEAESTLQGIFNAASESIWLFSTEGVALAANRVGLARMGARAANVIGKSFAEVFPPELAAARLSHLKRCVATGAPVDFEDVRDGLCLETTFCPVFGSDGRVERVASFTRDVTEVRAGHRALRANEERLRLGSQAGGFGTYTFDYITREANWSPELLAIWGLAPGTPVPLDDLGLPSFVHPDDRSALAQATRVASDPAGDGELHAEFRTLHPGGTIRWLRVRGKATFGGVGEARRAERLAGAVTDITRPRELEEQLRALAGRLQNVRELEQTRIARDLHDDLTQLLSGLSHELLRLEDWVHRTGATGWLEDWAVEATNLVSQAHASVRRIASGLRPKTLDSLGLGAALKLEATRFTSRTGVQCEVLLGALPDLQLPTVTTLYRITQEALTNVARHAAASQVAIRLVVEDGSVVLRVEDNGRGLRPERSSAGGLGLLGMRERAVLLGGEVRLEPNQLGGVTVIAKLPQVLENEPGLIR